MKIVSVGIHLLDKFQLKVDPGAVIAGGWVRDQFFNNEPKDIDIWTTVDFKRNGVVKVFKGATKVRRFYRKTLTDKRLIHVTKFLYRGIEVDIICFDVAAIPDKVSFNPVDSFDFGICQCWYSGKGSTGYQGTPLFWEDLRNHTLTYVSTPINDGRLHQIVSKRIPRLLAKFPEFSIRGLDYRLNSGDCYYRGVKVENTPRVVNAGTTTPPPVSATQEEHISMVESQVNDSLPVPQPAITNHRATFREQVLRNAQAVSSDNEATFDIETNTQDAELLRARREDVARRRDSRAASGRYVRYLQMYGAGPEVIRDAIAAPQDPPPPNPFSDLLRYHTQDVVGDHVNVPRRNGRTWQSFQEQVGNVHAAANDTDEQGTRPRGDLTIADWVSMRSEVASMLEREQASQEGNTDE